jgi:hypothetical protein
MHSRTASKESTARPSPSLPEKGDTPRFNKDAYSHVRNDIGFVPMEKGNLQKIRLCAWAGNLKATSTVSLLSARKNDRR